MNMDLTKIINLKSSSPLLNRFEFKNNTNKNDQPHSSPNNINEINDYLLNFDLFKGIEQEGRDYLRVSLERLLITLNLIPQSNTKLQILELGSNPYFLSVLIKKYFNCDLQLANFFNEHHTSPTGVEEVSNIKYNEKHIFPFKHFNIETDDFPYPSGFFDVVLFTEIIEHLIIDPVWVLSEINRILKIGGVIILTTPNVARAENVKKLQQGENIYDQYSGYGVYGRHNREYTVQELKLLLEGASFLPEKIFTADIINSPSKIIKNDRGENIFCQAKKIKDSFTFYPPWLFRSMKGYQKQSDDICSKEMIPKVEGLYHLENHPPLVRWSTKEMIIHNNHEYSRIKISLNSGYSNNDTCQIEIYYDNTLYTKYTFAQETWQEIELNNCKKTKNITFNILSSWRPCDIKNLDNKDHRILGIIISRIEFHA